MFELFDRPPKSGAPSLAEWIEHCIHPSDRSRLKRMARGHLSRGEGPFEAEVRALRRDGGNRWIVLRADVDRPSNDRRRLLGVALDVTEHHQALAALRQAGDRAALITRHAGIGTWEADLDGTPETIARGLAAGFTDYWTKPIDFTRFLAALEERFPAASPATPGRTDIVS